MSGDVALVSVLERLVTAVEQLVNGLESQKKLLAQTKPALTIEKPHEELAAWLPTLETKRKMRWNRDRSPDPSSALSLLR